MNVLVTPGQGGQRGLKINKDMIPIVPMYELGERFEPVRFAYGIADELAHEVYGKELLLGKTVTQWALEGTDSDFAQRTDVTQPLLVAAMVGLVDVVRAEHDIDTAVGNSLGELAALYAAGYISKEDAILLAIYRGMFSYEVAQQNPGKMAALMNLTKEYLEDQGFVFNDDDIISKIEGIAVSNINSPDQIVVAGEPDLVEELARKITQDMRESNVGKAKEDRAWAKVLPIGGAFHSYKMFDATEPFRAELEKIVFNTQPTARFHSNHSNEYESDPLIIIEDLVQQLIKKVNHWAALKALIEEGATHFIETGPGSKLTEIGRRQKALKVIPNKIVFTSYDEKLEEAA